MVGSVGATVPLESSGTPSPDPEVEECINGIVSKSSTYNVTLLFHVMCGLVSSQFVRFVINSEYSWLSGKDMSVLTRRVSL